MHYVVFVVVFLLGIVLIVIICIIWQNVIYCKLFAEAGIIILMLACVLQKS